VIATIMNTQPKKTDSPDREQAEALAVAAVRAAITRMLLHGSSTGVFFATLAMELRVEPDWDVGTAATDGDWLRIQPTWFMSLSKFERAGVVAHEVLHLAMMHHLRRGSRLYELWNVACDLAINSLLVGSGFMLPAACVFPGRKPYDSLADGLAAEDYYRELPEKLPELAASLVGNADSGGCGRVTDAAGGDDTTTSEMTKWRSRLVKARNAAELRGTLPSDLRRLVDAQVNPQVDYRQLLRQFLSASARDNYCWGRPNRRYVSRGVHLPSMRSDSIGPVVLAVDCSGSVFNETTLKHFAAECYGAMTAYSCTAKIVYFDAKVQSVEDWEPSHGPFVLRPVGGGGTSNVPVWSWLEKSGVSPSCVICLTDGYTDYGKEPDVPVLWVMSTDVVPPFGQSVRIEAA